MALAKVSGTKIRGGVYHLNLAISPEIRHLYQGRVLLTGTLKTADPKVAANGVTLARAKMIQQAEEMALSADINARLAELPPDQRVLYDRAGGLEGLLDALQRSQTALAFLSAGAPSTMPDSDELQLDPLEVELVAAEQRAASAVLEGVARREAKTLRVLGKKVEVPGGDIFGLAELAESFIRAKSYTVQNGDSVRYTVRRWTEFHGDQPLGKLNRAHLAEFDDAVRDLPVAREWLKKPMRTAVAAAEKGNLDRVSYKVRERLITHLKSLSAFALDKGALIIDPWAGYRIDKPKEKVADRKAQKITGFTPAEVKIILAKVAATAHADTADHWLPLLSAYTGARREELAQLRVIDVLTNGNIPALRITDEGPDQKVKNAHSLRIIPIPPVCVERGFLEFVSRRRQAGGTMLFLEQYADKRRNSILREMTPDPRGRLSEVYGGRFSRKILEPLGLKTSRRAFHALRHSWTDAARRAKIDPEIRRLIAGRLDDEDATEAGYGGSELLADKLEALIEVARYVEV